MEVLGEDPCSRHRMMTRTGKSSSRRHQRRQEGGRHRGTGVGRCRFRGAEGAGQDPEGRCPVQLPGCRWRRRSVLRRCVGAFTTVRPGLMRTDTLWKTLGESMCCGQPMNRRIRAGCSAHVEPPQGQQRGRQGLAGGRRRPGVGCGRDVRCGRREPFACLRTGRCRPADPWLLG